MNLETKVRKKGYNYQRGNQELKMYDRLSRVSEALQGNEKKKQYEQVTSIFAEFILKSREKTEPINAIFYFTEYIF